MQSTLRSGLPARLGAIAVLVSLLVIALPGAAQAKDKRDVTVMTRNMYLGTGLNNLVGTSGLGFVVAATTDWAHVKFQTDFNSRVVHLADEIEDNAPDVVGLQEVSLWRSQYPGDAAGGGTSPATTVEFDFLQQLRDELTSRGLNYVVKATSTNADVEAPTLANFADTSAGFRDVRLTDRDVILVNGNNANLVVDASGDAHYANQLSLPVGGGSSEFTRGYTFVDARADGKKFRFFNTHLEVDGGPAGVKQELQGNEAIAGPLTYDKGAVIAVGDYNSDANGTTTATYANLIASGLIDGWSVVHPGDVGLTCCHNELLTNATAAFDTRIDLTLSKGPARATSSTILGEDPADRFKAAGVPGGWPSDHAGVVTTFRLH
jgi:endonuclease/exonuclease/phosphatase family metal-dependent hydrolase